MRSGTYVVDVQSELLSYLPTRFVVPLLDERSSAQPVARLNPTFRTLDHEWLFAPQLAATATLRELGEPVGSLEHEHDAILAALDVLLTGV